jgi:hypothetical protein
MCDSDNPCLNICIGLMLVGCLFIGYAIGVTYMRYQAVSFKVATWQADESGRPNFVWKNMENN